MMAEKNDYSNLKLVLWCLAADPLILAAIGYVVRWRGALSTSLEPALGQSLFIVFTAVSLIMVGLGFQFASGRFLNRTKIPATPKEPLPPGHHIIAMAFFIAPGTLGLVHYLLFGDLWTLVLFNLGSSLLAARHILFGMETSL